MSSYLFEFFPNRDELYISDSIKTYGIQYCGNALNVLLVLFSAVKNPAFICIVLKCGNSS